jgi:hypothetical protein
MSKQDDEIKAAAAKAAEALRAMLEDECDFDVAANDVCAALEGLTAKLGAPSLSVRKLRRELQKRGFRD